MSGGKKEFLDAPQTSEEIILIGDRDKKGVAGTLSETSSESESEPEQEQEQEQTAVEEESEEESEEDDEEEEEKKLKQSTQMTGPPALVLITSASLPPAIAPTYISAQPPRMDTRTSHPPSSFSSKEDEEESGVMYHPIERAHKTVKLTYVRDYKLSDLTKEKVRSAPGMPAVDKFKVSLSDTAIAEMIKPIAATHKAAGNIIVPISIKLCTAENTSPWPLFCTIPYERMGVITINNRGQTGTVRILPGHVTEFGKGVENIVWGLYMEGGAAHQPSEHDYVSNHMCSELVGYYVEESGSTVAHSHQKNYEKLFEVDITGNGGPNKLSGLSFANMLYRVPIDSPLGRITKHYEAKYVMELTERNAKDAKFTTTDDGATYLFNKETFGVLKDVVRYQVLQHQKYVLDLSTGIPITFRVERKSPHGKGPVDSDEAISSVVSSFGEKGGSAAFEHIKNETFTVTLELLFEFYYFTHEKTPALTSHI